MRSGGAHMSTPDMARVLIADDHLIFRDGLRALLASAPDTELVGEAATGEEEIALATSLQPDLVLMDLQMPGVSGVEATRRVVQDSRISAFWSSRCSKTTTPSSQPCEP